MTERPIRTGWGLAACVVGVVLLVLATGCGGGGNELEDSAAENWGAVGGSYANDRYSTLEQITTENVDAFQADLQAKLAKLQ